MDPLLTVQYSAVQYSMVQYSTIKYNTVQYSTVQHSTVQYSSGTGWTKDDGAMYRPPRTLYSCKREKSHAKIPQVTRSKDDLSNQWESALCVCRQYRARYRANQSSIAGFHCYYFHFSTLHEADTKTWCVSRRQLGFTGSVTVSSL